MGIRGAQSDEISNAIDDDTFDGQTDEYPHSSHVLIYLMDQ